MSYKDRYFKLLKDTLYDKKDDVFRLDYYDHECLVKLDNQRIHIKEYINNFNEWFIQVYKCDNCNDFNEKEICPYCENDIKEDKPERSCDTCKFKYCDTYSDVCIKNNYPNWESKQEKIEKIDIPFPLKKGGDIMTKDEFIHKIADTLNKLIDKVEKDN